MVSIIILEGNQKVSVHAKITVKKHFEVEALDYSPEGRGIDSRWCHWNFFHVPIVLKSGILNLLEPSGPVKSCNGIAFFNFQM
jgi:hypothetical protein